MNTPEVNVIWTDWDSANERKVSTWEEAREVIEAVGTSPGPLRM